MRPLSLIDVLASEPSRTVLSDGRLSVSARELWDRTRRLTDELSTSADSPRSILLAGTSPRASVEYGLAAALSGVVLMATTSLAGSRSAFQKGRLPIRVILGAGLAGATAQEVLDAANDTPGTSVTFETDETPRDEYSSELADGLDWPSSCAWHDRRRIESEFQLDAARLQAVGVRPLAAIDVVGEVCDPPVLAFILAVVKAGGRIVIHRHSAPSMRSNPIVAGRPAALARLPKSGAGAVVVFLGEPCDIMRRAALERDGWRVCEEYRNGRVRRTVTPSDAPGAGFWRRARAHPQEPALIIGSEVISAGSLLARANAVAHGMRALGLGPGAVVAIPECGARDLIETYLATAQIGITFAPLNPELPVAVYSVLMRALQPGLVVVARTERDRSGYPSATVDELAEGKPSSTPSDRSPGAVMYHTSGTTGEPKAVVSLSMQSDTDTLQLGHAIAASCLGIGRPGVHLIAGPLWSAGPLSLALTALHTGSALVPMERWSPSNALRLIETHRVTSTFLASPMLEGLLALPYEDRIAADLSSLRALVHGAGPCAVEIKQRLMDWVGPVVYEHYASSEAAGTFVTPVEWLRRPGTVGREFPGGHVTVVHENGAVAGPREVGRVLVRHGGFRYVGPRVTDYVPGQDWLGDLGWLDEEGWLYLVGRESQLIKVGGVRVHAAAVESAVAAHPAVLGATAVGLPHPRLGQRVVLAVELRPGWGASAAVRAELKSFARRRLSMAERPGRIVFVDELPRDQAGTVNRSVVKAIVSEALLPRE